MHNLIEINKALKTPIYQQIVQSIITRIQNGSLANGDQLPSINQIAGEFGLARETVVKAFKHLQEKAIIQAVHGKGYFVHSLNLDQQHRVLLLFDTLSAYKEVMYHAIKDTFGADAFIDIYFHHFNPSVFQSIIKEHAGNYTSYIVLAFDHPKLNEMLAPIPKEKLYLIDRYPKVYSSPFNGVCQAFETDIFNSLESVREKAIQYKKFTLVFRNLITDPPYELVEGFVNFCKKYKIEYELTKASLIGRKINSGEAYLVIDDEDLVYAVEKSNQENLEIGRDIGIISYNETPLKKVVGKGISVISTDFWGMGEKIARMIIDSEHKCINNPCSFIDRGSF